MKQTKQTLLPMNLRFFNDPTPPVTNELTTPPVAAQTQSTAVSVDINTIIAQAETKAAEAATKKMEAVFKSMLEQQGLDADAINKMTIDWKSKQTTPESEIKRLTEELETAQTKISAHDKASVLRSYGLIDMEDIEVMTIRIDRLVSDGKDFAAAAKEYFIANPRPANPPASILPGVTGQTPLTGQINDLDSYKKLSAQEKIKFKNDNPSLYEQFKKALGF